MATLPVHPLAASSPCRAPFGHWIDVVSHLDPKYGGLSAVVPELSAAINRSGLFSTELAAFCAPDELTPSPASNPAFEGLPVTRWPLSRKPWFTDRKLRNRFLKTVEAADGVHLHGLWEQSTLAGARSARSLHKPYIVSAHGMLERWALENKKRKKQIYSAIAERSNLQGAACLHALTRAEADDYRRYGTRNPIAIIPNGVDVPASVTRTLFYEQYPALMGKRLVLFLGRIHFKKGLNLLVQAWKQVASQWPEAHLVLAGPDSEQTRPVVDRLIQDLEIDDRVSFTGMLQSSMKWSALSSAECFVLPSFSEGLSVSTLEAMGIGLPVIITERCNLPEVREFQAGWQIQSDVEQLTSALQECLSNTPEQNRQIGNNGRKLVADRFTWAAVGTQMTDLYRSVLDGSTPTSFELQTA